MLRRFLKPIYITRFFLRPQCYNSYFLFNKLITKRKFHALSVKKINANSRTGKLWNLNILRFYADLPNHTKVPLPALSPTMESGNLQNWLKKEGDEVNEGDPICDIETDKAVMSFDSPYVGYLAKILVPSGTQNLKLGTIICIIVENKEDVAAFKDFKVDAAPAPAAVAPAPAPKAEAPAPKKEEPADDSKRGRVSLMEQGLKKAREQRRQKPTKAEPPAVKKAAKKAKKRAKGKKAGIAKGEEYVDIPLKPEQIELAKRFLDIKLTVPHFLVSINCNMDKLLAFRDKANDLLARQKIELTLNDFIIKAAATAFHRHPDANSVWFDDSIKRFSHVDMSVAYYYNGFSTPTLRTLDCKGVIKIAKETAALEEVAKEGELTTDYDGGVMLVVNLSSKGIEQIQYICNPYQSTVLGVGTLIPRLILDEHEPRGYRLTQYTTFSVTGDHRVIDGALAALWLRTFKMLIEDPTQMIL